MQRIVAALLLLLGALLLWLAVPRLSASVHFLPVDTALNNYYASGVSPTQQLVALERQARTAIDRYPHYRYYEGLSLLRYLQGISEETRPWLQRPALVRSLQAAEQAVALAPGNPDSWLRIAWLRAYLGGARPDIAAAYKMSIYTGRVEPTLLLPRLELGLALSGQLDEESLRLLRDQTLLAWRTQPRPMQRAIKSGRLDVAGLKTVLGSNHPVLPELLESTP